MRTVISTLIVALAATSVPALAELKPQQSKADYICKIAGDCGTSTAATPTQDMPETKGFSIAGAGGAKPRAAAVPASNGRFSAQMGANAPIMPKRTRVNVPARGAAIAHSAASTAPRKGVDLLITFATGSTILTEQARVNSREFAKALVAPQLSTMRFSIEGHTDAVGGRAYNQDLSRRRAQAVIDFLTSQGVSRGRLEPKGYGFDRPVGSPMSPTNRRVEAVKVG
jgi:outer membrane protein OmpA-like peptidoglycan-associated protein